MDRDEVQTLKLWDLAVVVPAALVIGIGMLRGRDSARTPMYALLLSVVQLC